MSRRASRKSMATVRVGPKAAAESRAGYSLLVLHEGHDSTFPLPRQGAVVLGRSQSVDLPLDDPAISRRHASIQSAEGFPPTIVDLGSANGTRVNGARLDGERMLAIGDVISAGSATLVLRALADTAEAPATEEPLVLDGRPVIVADPVMVHVYQLLRQLARSELPVLLWGETGAGKEIAAAAVHAWSARGQARLVTINCAALPETLVESELFGFERGAFSGAVGSKPGLLESASGGTLFLDEVGELPLATQAKLLRVLETKRVTRLGALEDKRVDIRIVAATNRNLQDEVKAQRFRQDLYFRLGAATVRIPPLRERPREIPQLARAFLHAASASSDRPDRVLAPDAIRVLADHSWPGNVRELKNVIEYLAAVVAAPVISAGQVSAVLEHRAQGSAASPAPASEAAPTRLADEIRALERKRIAEALERCGGNKTRAAESIGMPVRTFTAKLKQYGIDST